MNSTNEHRYLPQVILAGAPKCGTTSVFDHLKDHPEICSSSVKETYYLIDKGYPVFRPDRNVHLQGWQGYEHFFSHCQNAADGLKLEATPDYLYQETPLHSIPEWPTRPKVFFVLRRPEERVYSLYRFAQNNLAILDKDISFSDFLALMGTKDSPFADRYILSNAIQQSCYVDFLLKWREAVGEDNIRVFLFEDFRRDQRGFMKQVADYLGIDPLFYRDYEFEVKNASTNVKLQGMHRLKGRISPYIANTALRRPLSWLYRKVNVTQAAASKVQSERTEVEKLAPRFFEANQRLEAEFGVDLAPWRTRK
ncbi:sulfotransferase domain-containing protein [Pseudohalioglobus sediminis]|uniref:Sulfotransferase domain-containing protein n=1 Tax=Pseudohalioglobus sediminis TaxID=2606449 RepID=A0A5B0WSB2_9GAMM|nr:sulfotransferase domain-containing protein [Pseudohalioglobus sediminis]KAA1189962.1 sulfotransferase domain-containing protein [Pseudohalioglobus sediminis]